MAHQKEKRKKCVVRKVFLKRFPQDFERFMHETALIGSWESKDTLRDEKWSLRHWDLGKVKLIFVFIHNGGKEEGRFGLDMTTGPPLAGGVESRTTFCNRSGRGSRTIVDSRGHQGTSVCIEADTDYGRSACVEGTQARQSSSGRWGGKTDRGEATTPPSTTSSCYLGIRNWPWILERDSCLTIPDKRRRKAVAFLFQSRNPYSRQNHRKASGKWFLWLSQAFRPGAGSWKQEGSTTAESGLWEFAFPIWHRGGIEWAKARPTITCHFHSKKYKNNMRFSDTKRGLQWVQFGWCHRKHDVWAARQACGYPQATGTHFI